MFINNRKVSHNTIQSYFLRVLKKNKQKNVTAQLSENYFLFQRILIIMPAWVGDMVMAQSILKYLKLQNPKCLIDIVAPPITHSISCRMVEIQNSFSLNIAHGEIGLKKRWQLAQQLRKNHYDWAIILTNSWKSALLPWLANIPHRTGWLGEWRYGLLNDVRILDKQKFPLMVQRFLSLGHKAHVAPLNVIAIEKFWPCLQSNSQQQSQVIEKFNLNYKNNKNVKGILAICPGAEYGPAKQWPAEYYAKLAQYKINKGWHIWILGSKKDQKLAQTIDEKVNGPIHNFCGITTLPEAIDLLALADLVVSNDSGLMHIASAVNRPVVAIYGSSSSAFTPPLSKRVKLLSLNLTCSPCFARTCKFQHYHCLRQLHPEQVYHACQAQELCR